LDNRFIGGTPRAFENQGAILLTLFKTAKYIPIFLMNSSLLKSLQGSDCRFKKTAIVALDVFLKLDANSKLYR
jgi:hypothetical protein